METLSATLELNGLRFASPERLKRYLVLEPGSVTLLAAFKDAERAVEMVVDEALSMPCYATHW